MKTSAISTGINGLDEILHNLQLGDNVVWQVDSIEDYKEFVKPYVKRALEQNKNIIYVRFASHPPLIEQSDGISVYEIDRDTGFEQFSTQIHNIIKKEGEGAYYVFDCLSDLLNSWATDLMIGNFFMITCPYLFELNTIAYFALLRNNHSFETIARIRETTQLLLDLFNIRSKYYLHPLKVVNRYSNTMFLPHLKQGEKFIPVTNSTEAARLFSYIYKKGAEIGKRKLDYWDRLFMKAQELISHKSTQEEQENMIDQLCRVMIGREEKMLSLAKKYFSIEDLLNIKAKMIGTGFIGGKAVGMLLARKILSTDVSFKWSEHLEPHDSFFIGSDVFYTYIVQNGWWKLLMEQKSSDKYFEAAEELYGKLLKGKFPYDIKEQFQGMMEYFGQSPIIVRSSSLLEDSFGNVFAGKYESIFCVNQGTPNERSQNFEEAVRNIFASTMNKDALYYRMQKGLSGMEEQMALLVQRVSGSSRKQYFFPDAAGVGISYNTFVWNDSIDPKTGMLRIVMGLGTRAVNRVEDDYPRIAALNNPLLKPFAGMKDTRKYSQRKLDVLNINKNILETVSLSDLLDEEINLNMELFGDKDYETTETMRKLGKKEGEAWIVNFDRFLSETDFAKTMQRMFKFLERQYEYPVDIEFTANFSEGSNVQINLLQCRPLQSKGEHKRVEIPKDVSKDRILLYSDGNFMGGNISRWIKRVIYVDAAAYSELPIASKYDIARLIGKLNREIKKKDDLPTVIIGPGRWGTTTPSMGIPVSFYEINNASALVEVSFRTANLAPEVSFGTHFFQDLVETEIFYIALFTEKDNVILNTDLIKSLPNLLEKLLPEYGGYHNVVSVCDFKEDELHLSADIISQKAICYL